MASDIADNYRAIRENIARICERVGRDPAEVTLVAVSKTVGMPEIERAIAAGIHDFGENRTSLFNEKRAAFPDERWHFIGSIQTNKIKDFVGRAALVHSVASERALAGIARRAQLLGITQRLLFEVNVSGEQSKDGIAPEELPALLESASQLEGIEVRGLMTMAPQGDEDAIRAVFRGLRQLRDRCAAPYGGAILSGASSSLDSPSIGSALPDAASNRVTKRIHLCELSMGMSEDYPLAIEEGATIVRIGRSMWA